MASACVNNTVAIDHHTPTTFPWLTTNTTTNKVSSPPPEIPDLEEESSPEVGDAGDFEFRLHDPVAMLPADLLFSDGKLVPLHLPSLTAAAQPLKQETEAPEIKFPAEMIGGSGCLRTKSEAASGGGAESGYLFSPKAPRCSSRWRELLGLKKSIEGNHNTNSTSSSSNQASALGAEKSIRRFFHRSSKSASFSGSLTIPLLKDSSDSESVSVSSRLSLSSSSSGHDVDDLRRMSLDTDKPNHLHLNRSSSGPNPPKVRLVKSRPLMDHTGPAGVGRGPVVRRGNQDPKSVGPLGVAADSPRMNSSGKIVFKGLERSSSSPSSLNGGGGTRYKYGGMERSYSANVRVTPVLNVPVCSLRGSSKSGVFGFGQFFSSSSQCSSQKGAGNGKVSHQYQNQCEQQLGGNGKSRKEST